MDIKIDKIAKWARTACSARGLGHMSDDVAAEALYRAWNDVVQGRYNPELSSFETWTCRKVLYVLREVVAPAHRRRFQHIIYETPFSLLTPPADPDDDDGEEEVPLSLQPSYTDQYDIEEDEPDWLCQVLDLLTEREEEVFWLLAENGEPMTTREIGAAIGVSHVTAGKVLNSIRSKVAFALHTHAYPAWSGKVVSAHM